MSDAELVEIARSEVIRMADRGIAPTAEDYDKGKCSEAPNARWIKDHVGFRKLVLSARLQPAWGGRYGAKRLSKFDGPLSYEEAHACSIRSFFERGFQVGKGIPE